MVFSIINSLAKALLDAFRNFQKIIPFDYGESATGTVVGLGSGCILIIIVVLAVYLHKKFRLQYGVNFRLPCCDKSNKPSSTLGCHDDTYWRQPSPHPAILGTGRRSVDTRTQTFQFEEMELYELPTGTTEGEAFRVPEADTSSDSDEEIINTLHKSITLQSTDAALHPPHFNIRTQIDGENENETRSSASSCCSSTSMDDGVRNREKKLKKMDSQQESQNDCIVIMGQEPAFDLSDVKRGGQGEGKGAVQISLAYDTPTRKLTLHLLQATDMPSPPTFIQVRVVLLPHKKQKHKSRSRQGEHPEFMESFLFHKINPEDVSKLGVRLRVYAWERLRRQRLIGEAHLSFAQVNLELESNLWLTMDSSSPTTALTWCGDIVSLNQSDSTGSTASLQQGVAELLVGLSYSGTTGRLSVEIIKGSHFRDIQINRAPDTYCKLCLVSSTGQEMARSKTSVRRSQPNPLFKETFMFQVALFQLADVTLMISVYCKRAMKRKDMLGWFCLGQNSSGVEELSHWQDMCQVKGEQICRWHVLIEK